MTFQKSWWLIKTMGQLIIMAILVINSMLEHEYF